MQFDFGSLSIPVAVGATVLAFAVALISPGVVLNKSRSWKNLREAQSKLTSYAVDTSDLSKSGQLATADILEHRYLSDAVVLVSHVYPSSNAAIKQIARDAASDFLKYLVVGVLVFVAISSQSSSADVSMTTAFAGMFLGIDLLLVYRLYERYRVLTDQIDSFSTTMTAVG